MSGTSRPRACQSVNHRGDRRESAVRKDGALLFKCPKCKKGFCTRCEGADEFKVCDTCWKFMHDRRYLKLTYLKWIKTYGWRSERKRLTAEYLDEIKFGTTEEGREVVNR